MSVVTPSDLRMQSSECECPHCRGMLDLAADELDRLKARIATLFDAIAHGDDAHRAWLKAKIEEHFA